MRTVTQEEFNYALRDHKEWLAWTAERAVNKLRSTTAEAQLMTKKRMHFATCDLSQCNVPSYSNLQGIHLHDVICRDMDFTGVDFTRASIIGCDFTHAYLNESRFTSATLTRTNFTNAELENVSFHSADLTNTIFIDTNIDYSSFQLSCNTLRMITDARIARQFAYHFCSLKCDDPAFIAARNSILEFANQFHRAIECGILKPK